MSGGFLIAAPHSGSGKTIITLGLMRAFVDSGQRVAPFKAGPDYIDPGFHTHAARAECFNLDPWAMRADLIYALSARDGLCVIEGMMGLFDGAADGSGSCADLAALLKLPVVLVIDCARQSHSIAALVQGFRDYRKDVTIGALILNRVSTQRHETLLRDALRPLGIAVAGVVPVMDDLHLPARHLGLVQAGEHDQLEAFVAGAAHVMNERIDLALLSALGGARHSIARARVKTIAPLGQRIAVAQDRAFAFSYPHLLKGWRESGAEISFFSPLANQAPQATSDAIFLPGGYPELYAGQIAANSDFMTGLLEARKRGAIIYGECGGFMVLGDGLVDAQGIRHKMSGLLPVETSYETRARHLGYRKLTARTGTLFSGRYRAHEFHYSHLVAQGAGQILFDCEDAHGVHLGGHGLQVGAVAGSYLHLIDLEHS